MKKALARYAPVIIGVVVLALLMSAGIYFVANLKSDAAQKKVVQQITVIKPPPIKEEPPPQEEIEEEVEEQIKDEPLDEPEPVPDQGADEPVGEELGLDAEGTAGGDSFGLKAKKGGRGFLGGGSAYGNYLKTEINKAITQSEALKYLDYVAVVSIELAPSGRFEKIKVELEDGDDSTRKKLLAFFESMGGVNRSVPLEEKESVFRMKIRSVI